MALYLVFNLVLIFLVVGGLFFIFRSIFKIQTLNNEASKQFMDLEAKLKKENKKLLLNNKKVLLLDDLNQRLITSILKISRDLILLQKLIFDKKL